MSEPNPSLFSQYSHFHAREDRSVKLGNSNGIKYEKQEPSDQQKSSDKGDGKRSEAKVDIYNSKETLILPKAIGENVLKRFSKHARDGNISTGNKKNPTYILPGFTCCQPSTDAVKWLMDWCQANDGVDDTSPPTADDIGEDLVFKIDVYATMRAIQFFSPKSLEDSLHKIIKAEPMPAQALVALWDLLGKNATHRLMKDAVFSLNRFYRKNEIDPEENEKMENYISYEDELDRMFAEARVRKPKTDAPADGRTGDATGGDGGWEQEGDESAGAGAGGDGAGAGASGGWGRDYDFGGNGGAGTEASCFRLLTPSCLLKTLCFFKMGNPNFRGNNAAIAKPYVQLIETIQSTQPTTFRQKPRKIVLNVDVYTPDGRVVVSNLSIRGLKRFIRHAWAQLPRHNMTADPNQTVLEYHLPKRIGLVDRYPTDEAITILMAFIDANKYSNDKPIMTLPTLGVPDLEHAIEVFSLARTLDMTLTTRPLSQEIAAKMRESPITIKELSACWELLDTSKHLLIVEAIRTLTTFYTESKIPHEQNREIEEYYSKDAVLEDLFGVEEARQKRHRKEAERMRQARKQLAAQGQRQAQ
ncbi:hypothetical protein Tdes44962_MAKER00375 [Teratosphaeria destructans]|uniref:Uncharacterized protein n=1 Tax=Teratosphaeria destructans TaxID=418781 RepID=A0A9W7W2Q9_9PEZI|nr:hypothetical protein Tdes44962_MAKER00375 [Teratosphaeria destructans]